MNSSWRKMQQTGSLVARLGFRKAAANFGWLFIERLVRFLFGALVGLLVARYLGPARLGSLSYCIALVTLIGFLPALGLDAIIKRDLLRLPETTAEVLASSFMIRLAAAALAYAGVLLAAHLGWGLSPEESRLFAIVGLILFQPALFLPELWLQAHLRAKWAAAAQLVALALASVLRVWLISTNATLSSFAWVIVGEMVFGGIAFLWVARRVGLILPLAAARVATMQRLLREAWPLILASLAVLVYLRTDEVMLRHMVGPEAVGTYAAAAKLSEIWYFLPIALASSVLPALLRAQKNSPAEYGKRQQQYYDLSAALAYGLSIPIALAAPWIVQVAYGPEFATSAPILAVHIWSSIFVFLGVARGQWLVNEGLQKFYFAATAAGAVANVLLNLVFIPRWGGLGAAYATVISYALAAWGSSYFHPAVRATAAMQTRALLIPVLGWRYLRRT